MTIQHKDIPEAQLHEPKGVSTATARKVYVSNGAGTGSWQYVYPEGTASAAAGKTFITDGAGGGSFELPAGRAHAELYITGGVTLFQLNGNQGIYIKLDPNTDWKQGEINLLTTTPNDGYITLTKAGTYQVNFHVIFSTASGTGSNSVYYFKWLLNNVESTRSVHAHKKVTGVDHLDTSASFLVTVAANTTLALAIAGDPQTAGTNIIVEEAGLTAVYLAE